MDVATFTASLDQAAPPGHLDQALQGLWWAARGEWDRAHQCAQNQSNRDGDAVHAYLHRQEGDLPNALYWYGRAGRAAATGSLDDEWKTLVGELLAR